MHLQLGAVNMGHPDSIALRLRPWAARVAGGRAGTMLAQAGGISPTGQLETH